MTGSGVSGDVQANAEITLPNSAKILDTQFRTFNNTLQMGMDLLSSEGISVGSNKLKRFVGVRNRFILGVTRRSTARQFRKD